MSTQKEICPRCKKELDDDGKMAFDQDIEHCFFCNQSYHLDCIIQHEGCLKCNKKWPKFNFKTTLFQKEYDLSYNPLIEKTKKIIAYANRKK